MLRRFFLYLLLGLFVLPLSGCAWAIVAVAGSLGASSASQSGGSSSGGNNAPVVVVGAVTRQTDKVSIPYTLSDADGDSLSISVEIFQNGTLLFQAADAGIANNSEGISDLNSSPEGVSHLFVWDSSANFGDIVTRKNLTVRIVARDSGSGSLVSESNTFQINNTLPTLSIDDSAFQNKVTGNLALIFNAVDADDELVDVTIRISDDNGLTFRDVPNSAVVVGTNLGLLTDSVGKRFSLAIDTSNSALFPNRTINTAILEVSAVDLAGAGPADRSAVFTIDNNTPPDLVLESNNDDSLEVNIVFRLSDAEATTAPGTTGFVLNTGGMTGVLNAVDFPSLPSPITPGTVLIRYDGSRVIRDIDNGDGTGRFVAINGPGFQGEVSINYASGSFAGLGTLSVDGSLSSAVTADFNRNFAIVESIEFQDLRGQQGFRPCTALIPSQQTPFPVFVTPMEQRLSFVWDSLRDLDFGNSKSVRIRLQVNDGQVSSSQTGNSFLVDNGPLSKPRFINNTGNGLLLFDGDFDGDNIADVLVVNRASPSLPSISIFFGNGQSLNPAVNQSFPIPRKNGVNLLSTPDIGLLPAGSFSPFAATLIDVNRDGIQDLAIAGGPESFEKFGPTYNEFLIYFGTGNRAMPFDVNNAWGPFRGGGAAIASMTAAPLNDDNNDGVVDSHDTADLIIVSGFSRRPYSTATRSPIVRNIPVVGEALAMPTGAPYPLANQSLAVTPVQSGSIQLLFDGTRLVVDQALPGGILGVVVDTVTQAPFCYIIYPTGAFVADPRQFGIPAPLGPLPGMTPFAPSTSAIANYQQAVPILPNNLINDARFVTTPLVNGDTLTIKGFGSKGLSILTQASNGAPLVNGQGLPLAVLNKDDTLLPINLPINGTLTVGTDVSTFQDLLNQIRALYLAERVIPANEDVVVSLEQGRIVLRLQKSNPAQPDSLTSPQPSSQTCMEIKITDSQGNQWPVFEDPFGRVTVYHVRPVDNEGGFSAPELTSTFSPTMGGPAIFPPTFPAARIDLFPENPTSTGRAGAPGPGTLSTVFALVDSLQGAVIFPPTYSIAAGAAPSLPNPLVPPGHLDQDALTMTRINAGLSPFRASVGAAFPFNPNPLTGGGPTDALPDIVVSTRGDSALIALVKTPKAILSAQSADLAQYFALFPYLDGIYTNQAFELGSLINSEALQVLGVVQGPAAFVQPNTDLGVPLLDDVDGDSFTDITVTAGNLTVFARSLLGTPVPGALPFDIQAAVPGLIPGNVTVADVNNDGLKDLIIPASGTSDVLTLLQQPPVNATLISQGPGQAVALTGLVLPNLDGVAFVSAASLDIRFQSGGIEHSLQGQSDFSLRLIRDPDGNPTDLGAVGAVNPQTGALLGSTVVTVDSAVTARFDRLFFSQYVNNQSLKNFRCVRFPSGFGPGESVAIDINQDKLLDVIALDLTSNNLTIFQQMNELPIETNFQTIATGLGPLRIDRGDFITGNGVDEVLVVNTNSSTISVFVPDPINGLVLVEEIQLSATPSFLPAPSFPLGMRLSDLDDNGTLDLVVVCNVALGANQVVVPGVLEPFSSCFVIIPGRTQVELAAAQAAGVSAFPITHVGLGFNNPFDVEIVDVNNDGLKDILVGNATLNFLLNTEGFLSTHLNQGNNGSGVPNFGNIPNPALPGQFLPLSGPFAGPINAPTRIYTTPSRFPNQMQILDLNSDGFNEIVHAVGGSASPSSGRITIVQGKDPTADNEPFELDPSPIIPGSILPRLIDVSGITAVTNTSVVSGDFNQDGKADLALADIVNGGSVGVLINNANTGAVLSSTSFVSIPLPAVGLPGFPAIGDVNNDGLPDIVVPSVEVIAVYINQYDANNPSLFDPSNPSNQLMNLFAAPVFLRGNQGSAAVTITDLNGDGKNDIAVVSLAENTVNVFFQR